MLPVTHLLRALVLVAILVNAGSAAGSRFAEVIRVPQDAPTLAAAVAAAGPGATIVLDAGSYRGGVTVASDKRGVTIRGVDRNRVVFDGGDKRMTAITVHADGVALENMSAHNYLGNVFYWEDVNGFRASYLTVWNTRGYGIYSEGSTGGLVDHDYVSGAADAAFYVGECNPCSTTLTQLVAQLSAVGYSGTNASGGLVISDSLWDGNGAGILPNSYANEKKPPQQRATIVGNTVTRSGRARVPLHTPLAGFYGIGIGIAGGNSNQIRGNSVLASRRYGIAVFPTAYWIPIDPRPPPPGRHSPWRPRGNSVTQNMIRHSGIADLALAAGSGARNCFSGNNARRTLPRRLQSSCALRGDRTVARRLTASIPTMISRAYRALRPPSYKAMPAPPPQPNMP
jgi:hypothetical protein